MEADTYPAKRYLVYPRSCPALYQWNGLSMKLYCLLCAKAFLSAINIIQYETDTAEGWTKGRDPYHERGYEAIEGLARLMDNAHLLGERFRVYINNQFSEGMLYATIMIRGTSVCTSHVEAYDSMTTPQGRRVLEWP